MGSLAILASELGHKVTGSDQNVYPPMSTQLENYGIKLIQGYEPEQLKPIPDIVIVGNAISRGNPALEFILNNNIKYTSGPQWLAEHLLQNKWVLAAAGTHGKTTTATMLAWILEQAGYSPGFLIGGVPLDFPCSARLGNSSYFVIEADEYDTAFFDKRSKFVHYKPRTLIMNNLEYDHADIFPDLAAIQQQFHHLVRTIPTKGQIILPQADSALKEVLAKGVWSELVYTDIQADSSVQWHTTNVNPDASRFEILLNGISVGKIKWKMTGLHNVSNALSALAAAYHIGITPEISIAALNSFAGIKRRMELIGKVNNIYLYDDFAHHPTAIASTLEGIKAQVGTGKVIAVIEPRSNTMRMGIHQTTLLDATALANQVYWYQPSHLDWSLNNLVAKDKTEDKLFTDSQLLIEHLVNNLEPDSHVVMMSNGGFDNIHQRLLQALKTRYPTL